MEKGASTVRKDQKVNLSFISCTRSSSSVRKKDVDGSEMLINATQSKNVPGAKATIQLVNALRSNMVLISRRHISMSAQRLRVFKKRLR
jgi:hypothetical protein